jgi:hypothetical protein
MPRTGRPPLTEAVIRERIATYCARYGVGLTDAGFPAYPAGLRETPQHREWITLFKVFSRLRDRSTPEGSVRSRSSRGTAGTCAICLKALPRQGKPHRQCAEIVEFIRELGVPALDRIRAAAFPDDANAPGAARSGTKRRT